MRCVYSGQVPLLLNKENCSRATILVCSVHEICYFNLMHAFAWICHIPHKLYIVRHFKNTAKRMKWLYICMTLPTFLPMLCNSLIWKSKLML